MNATRHGNRAGRDVIGTFSRIGPATAIGVLLLLLAAAPSSADRRQGLLLAVDHHLVRADFIGRIRVNEVERAPDLSRIRATILDTWFTRWPLDSESLTISFSSRFPGARAFSQGADLVVLLSGGPWLESPFTHRENSIFHVSSDGGVQCSSGNPLYAVTADQIHCSIPEITIGEPLTVDEMRDAVIALRANVAETPTAS